MGLFRMDITCEILDKLEKVIDRLSCIEMALSLPVADFVSMKNAAVVTGLSYSHIRRAVLSGELSASNNGTSSHPIYRIARTDLNAWMERKKGGTANILPASSTV